MKTFVDCVHEGAQILSALGVYDARDVVSVSFNGYGGAHLHMKVMALAAMIERASDIWDCKVRLRDQGDGRYTGTLTMPINGKPAEATLTAIGDVDGILKRFVNVPPAVSAEPEPAVRADAGIAELPDDLVAKMAQVADAQGLSHTVVEERGDVVLPAAPGVAYYAEDF